jgi:hypothetical protein
VIDISNEVFNAVATAVRAKHSPVAVIPENTSTPASFPTVAMDETYNVDSQNDSSGKAKFAAVTYRVQVFCSGDGKRAKAREIFSTVADTMRGLNLMRKTYTTTPDVYNSSVYQITATFEADVRHDGFIFRR